MAPRSLTFEKGDILTIEAEFHAAVRPAKIRPSLPVPSGSKSITLNE